MNKDVETSGKYVLPSKLNYEDYLTAVGQRAQDSYKKEVLAAGNAYSSALSNAGANAAALSSMGLTGSGYSTYLDSQAYAQKQNAVNLAKTSLDSELNKVEGLYADYLVKKEADRQTNYANLMKDIDAYTLNDIANMGAQYGFDEPTITALKNAKNERTAASLLGGKYYKSDIDNLVAAGVLDPNSVSYTNLLNGLKKVTSSDVSGMFNGVDYDEGKTALDGVISNLDSEKDAALIEALNAEFDKTYKPRISFKKDGGLRDRPGKKGNNIKLEDSDGKVYRVQYNGETLDPKNIQGTIVDGTVFMYEGALYVRVGNKYYGIEARPFNSNYTDLVKKFS